MVGATRKPDQEEALLDARGESAASDTLPWRPIHYLGSKLRVLEYDPRSLGPSISTGHSSV